MGDIPRLIDDWQDGRPLPIQLAVFLPAMEFPAPCLASGDGLPEVLIFFSGDFVRLGQARVLPRAPWPTRNVSPGRTWD